MNLLRDIQLAAIDGASDLETLLRKCRVLASRLKLDDFQNWVQWELDGYPQGVNLPDYRKFDCQCYGHFSGPFGSGLRNAPIPDSCIPADVRDVLTRVEMRHGVASLKDLVEECEDGNLHYQWPADANPLFGRQIYERMVLVSGWSLIPKNSVVGILSTVRNRILNFALEIEASNPNAGEATPGSTPVPKETVSQIFHTHIYGNVGNVATGHDITQTATVSIQQGDFRSLETFLEKQGVSKEDLKELDSAVQAEPNVVGGKFGKRVSSWIGKMVQKSAEGVWKITTDVAAKLIAEALKAYYGF